VRRAINRLIRLACLVAVVLALHAPVVAQGGGPYQLYMPLVLDKVDLPQPSILALNNAPTSCDYIIRWQTLSNYYDSYEVQRSQDADFGNSVTVCITTAGECTVPAELDGTWYFRVSGRIASQPSNVWSSTYTATLRTGMLVYNENTTQLWNMPRVGAPSGWSCISAGRGVTVAVLDTGIYTQHPDLVPNLLAGYNFVDGNTIVDDLNGHGTHVSGIIAAAINNGGVVGVAPRVSLLPVKVCGSNCPWDAVAAGIRYAVDHGARVINLSLAGTTPSDTLYEAISYAYSHNVVLIAAAGNYDNDTVRYPAAYTETLSVAATDINDLRATWSSYGPNTDLAAPGVNISSTVPNSPYYALKLGTSMAAPHVAGAAAILISAQPSLTAVQARNLITSTARDLVYSGNPSYGAGWDPYTGWGRLDVTAALARLPLAAVASDDPPLSAEAWSSAASPHPTSYVAGEVLYALVKEPGLTPQAAPLAPLALARAGIRSRRVAAGMPVWVAEVPRGQEKAWVERLRNDPRVAYAELNGFLELQ